MTGNWEGETQIASKNLSAIDIITHTEIGNGS